MIAEATMVRRRRTRKTAKQNGGLYDGLVIDLFAGGGGASTGIEAALGRSVDIAINHDPAAVAMHRVNHPHTLHLCQDVFTADPMEVCGGKRIDFLWASPDCFPEGTLILTSSGYRPIESIQEGDFVLTHNGRYRRVTATMQTTRSLIRVSGQGHPGLIVSPEHPFYARDQKNVWNKSRRKYDRTLLPAEWRAAKDLRTGAADMNKKGGDRSFWATPCRFPLKKIPKVPGRGMKTDEKLMWLAGRYLGDGWTRLNEDRAELVITCSKSEVDVLGPLLERDWRAKPGKRARSNELKWWRRYTKTAHQFSTSHRGLVTWLRAEFGHGAAEKSLPAWALGMSRHLRLALLDGYTSADGHRRGDTFHCSTVSKSLAFSLRALVESLGHSVNVNGPYPNRNTIEDRPVNATPIWTVKWNIAPQRVQNTRDSRHNWTRIRNIEELDIRASVYNLSVEDDESYVAEGIVVHNCTFFSKARGGKPIRDEKRRDLAWVVVRWASLPKRIRPRVIMLENVEEFRDWGPLADNGRPCPDRKGQTFKRWVRELRRHGYTVEWRELRGCDYGSPTIRKRLFLIARCDGEEIIWPEATHGSDRQPFRTAAECIDFSIPCPSIFLTQAEAKELGLNVKRPLAENSLKRIAAGILRHVIDDPKPFIVSYYSPHSEGVCASARGGEAVVMPHITHAHQGGSIKSAAEPLNTITASRKDQTAVVAAYAAPFIGHQRGTNKAGTRIDQPANTITAGGQHQALISTVIETGYGERKGQRPRAHDPNKPLGTIVGNGKHALATAFMARHFGGMTGRDLRTAHPTITTHSPQNQLVQLDLSSVGVRDRATEVHAFLCSFYGSGSGKTGRDVRKPLPTVTTKERHQVVTVDVDGESRIIFDIGMRMLTPRELYRCQGFGDDYIIEYGVDENHRMIELTKTQQVHFCGNSVCPQIPAALVAANLSGVAA